MADRKISDLTALTTPASGDYLPIVDISEAAAASKNKRITIEELMRGVPNGTAAAPGIAFETYPSTGIYSSGANQLAVATNGVGRLFVDASGNVGVGATPSAAFHLTRSAADAVARIDGGSSNTAFIDFRIAGANKSYVGLGGLTGGSNDDLINYNSSAGNWIAYTSGTEKLRITAAGLVGIGTSAPGTTLEVSAGGGSSPSLTGTGGNFAITQPGLLTSLEFGGYSSAPYGLWLQTKNKTGGSFPLILNPLGGAVGIGTTAPGSPLSVQGSDNSVIAHFHGTTGTNTRGLQIGLATNVTANHLVDLNAVGTYGTLTFSSNSNEKARIDSSGRLLIGTSSNFGSNAICIVRGNSDSSAGPGVLDIKFGATRPATANQTIGVLRFPSISQTTGSNVYAEIRAETDGASSSDSDIPGRLVFSTTSDSASSPTERLRITSTGQVRLAGAGITFNGDTAAANELDDYEEGSCTLLVSDSLGNNATADSNNDQQYTKIGRKVTVTGTLTWSSTAALAADSRIKITGLPFAAVGSLGSVRAPAIFGSSTSGSFNITRSEIGFGADPGQTFIFGTKVSGNNVDDIMVKADLGTSGVLFGLQITYFTA